MRLPDIFVCVVPAKPPVTPPETLGVAQLYVVPVGTMPSVAFVGVEVNVPELQIVAVIGFIDGFGLAVTTTVNVTPVHVFAVGVIVYVAY